MAKLTFSLWDDVDENGAATVKGRMHTEVAPPVADGMPAAVATPAQIMMITIKRLWDTEAVARMAKLICPDLLYQNQMLAKIMAEKKQQELQAIEKAGGVSLDADKIRAAAANAEIVVPEVKQPAAVAGDADATPGA